ncbi:MAG: hypothetical protein ACLT98_16370 [Eggerthellaceae bacterium]
MNYDRHRPRFVHRIGRTGSRGQASRIVRKPETADTLRDIELVSAPIRDGSAFVHAEQAAEGRLKAARADAPRPRDQQAARRWPRAAEARPAAGAGRRRAEEPQRKPQKPPRRSQPNIAASRANAKQAAGQRSGKPRSGARASVFGEGAVGSPSGRAHRRPRPAAQRRQAQIDVMDGGKRKHPRFPPPAALLLLRCKACEDPAARLRVQRAAKPGVWQSQCP